MHLQVGSADKEQQSLNEQDGIAVGDAVAGVPDIAPFHSVNALVIGLKRVLGKVVKPTKQGEWRDELDAKQGAWIGVDVVHEIRNDEIRNDAAGENPEVSGHVGRAGELEESLKKS